MLSIVIDMNKLVTDLKALHEETLIILKALKLTTQSELISQILMTLVPSVLSMVLSHCQQNLKL